jgi:mono/diheme cytochrome c family protein
MISTSQAAPISFQRDVRPILTAHCVECHGPDTQESGLRVDRRADLLKGGKSGRCRPMARA